MSDVVVFHHAHGLTEGVRAFARRLGEAGHQVSVPDLYDGATFDTRDDGVAHAGEVGFGTVIDRGRRAVEDLPAATVYVGLSLGVLPAQLLAQTRPGAAGAVLVGSCMPPQELGTDWPAGVPVQVHAMADDPIFAGEGDLDAARGLVASTGRAELFLYPGDRHLFMDEGLPDYDPAAASRLTERVLAFLAAI